MIELPPADPERPQVNSSDESTSMDATRLTLIIVLPLLFLLILVGIIIALAIYIAGWKKIHRRKVATNNYYNHVDKNNYGLTPI